MNADATQSPRLRVVSPNPTTSTTSPAPAPAVASPPAEPAPMTLEQAQGVVAAAGNLPRCGRCSIPYGWLSEEGAEDHRALHRARRIIAEAVDARRRTSDGPPCLGGNR